VDTDGDMALVISGVGRAASAAACGWLQGFLHPPEHSAWINCGIGGRGRGPLGSVLTADRVVEVATGRAWYPPPLPSVELSSETVWTVDKPEFEFGEEGVYDMEAAGFLTATGRLGTVELAQVVKVVSDTCGQPSMGLDKARVSELIEAALPEIDRLASALTSLTAVLDERHAPPKSFDELRRRWSFSVTQTRRLRRLLDRHRALAGESRAIEEIDARDARGALEVLQRRVERLAVES
jgi:hypothetical protein